MPPIVDLLPLNLGLIRTGLNTVRSLLAFFEARGVSRKEVLALLDKAEAEGRDVTAGELTVLMDKAQAEIDKLKSKADADEKKAESKK